MQRTQSAGPLEAVQLARQGAVTHVWLRRNVERVTVTGEDGTEQEAWEADEQHGALPGTPTAAEVAARLDELWEEFAEAELTDADRLAAAREAAATNGDAIAELAEMVAEGEVTMEDLAQAIVELAEIVGGGE